MLTQTTVVTAVRAVMMSRLSRALLEVHLADFPRDDEEDETAALMRELEKIKKERAEAKAKEVRLLLNCIMELVLIFDRKRSAQPRRRNSAKSTLHAEIHS